jgi:hypothetical protein
MAVWPRYDFRRWLLNELSPEDQCFVEEKPIFNENCQTHASLKKKKKLNKLCILYSQKQIAMAYVWIQ